MSHGKEVADSAFKSTDNDDGLTEQELHDLWDWAPVTANREAKRRKWRGEADYTLEEKEGGVKNVVTGLKRKLEEGESSSEEEEEEDEDYEGEGSEEEGTNEDEMEIVGVRRKSDGKGMEFDVSRVGDRSPAGGVGAVDAISMVGADQLFRFGIIGTATRARGR